MKLPDCEVVSNERFFPLGCVVFLLVLTSCQSAKISSLAPGSSPTEVDSKIAEVILRPRSEVEAHGKKWMVSTQGKYATDAAAEILKRGGNIVDAAIAASFTIGVERPHSTGIGGGGFLIYYNAKTKKATALDFRERAPLKAHQDMYLNEKKEVIPDLSVSGGLAVAVPGLVKGLKATHARFGKLKWSTLLNPAIRLAANGFPVYPALSRALKSEADVLCKFNESKETFLKKNCVPYAEGETLVQKNLSHTLEIIARDPDQFYRGTLANKMVAGVKKEGGVLSLRDLRSYQIRERAPIISSWKGFQIIAMPPPSSGGVHVVQILKMLEKDHLNGAPFWDAHTVNLVSQAMQQAFADRAEYMGDPDFIAVNSKAMIDPDYLRHLRSKFLSDRARPGTMVHAGNFKEKDHTETTHFSIMDEAGNVVVSTQTINGYFGSGVIAEGTGIVMNNEMDDFAAKVGASNIFGATATSNANSVAPRKTPLSSMSPTIVLKNGIPVMAVGAPGGTRIITAVAQTILHYFENHEDLYTAVATPRIHEQWQPDVLRIENQPVSKEVISELKSMGWNVERVPSQSNVMAIVREGKDLIGVSDPRDAGKSLGE